MTISVPARTGNYGPEVAPAPTNVTAFTNQNGGALSILPDTDWTDLLVLPVTFDGSRTLLALFSGGVEVVGTNPVVFFRVQLDGAGEAGGFIGTIGNSLITAQMSCFALFPPPGGGVAVRVVKVQWKTLFPGTIGTATVVASGLNGCPQLMTLLLP